MKLPDGWVFTLHPIKKGAGVEMEEKELVMCRSCKYLCQFSDRHYECRLIYDNKPIQHTYHTMQLDDFCSYGERIEE